MSKKLVKKSRADTFNHSAFSHGFFTLPSKSNFDSGGARSLMLYRYVYSSTPSLVCAFLLLISFIMQGFYVAHAEEIVPQEDTVITTTVAAQQESENKDVTNIIKYETEAGKVILDEVVDQEIIDSKNEEDVEKTEIISVGLGGGLIAEETYSSATSASTSSDAISESTQQGEATTSDEIVSGGTAESATDNNDPYEEKDKQVAATSTDDIEVSTSTTHESVSFVQSDSELTFSENDCTRLADGSFYCKESNEEQLKDALFSARDQDGDLEIFLVRDGKQAQITENKVDDASPYFDEVSDTIVWQRLIDERFQIIDYDLKTGNEMQITDGSVNNMEPTKQGKYTVWQRWVDDSWDIVLFDGTTEKEITHDQNHNISPHIQGSLVIWNRTAVGGEKTIEMYNIDSQAYVSVNDPDGLAVDNPRMVLVYDSLHPNGDIVTKGFDIFTGKFIQLDTLPKSLPDIPDSETTTEVKALIQPKENDVVVDIENKIPDVDPNNEGVTNDLDLSLDSSVSTNTVMTLGLSQSTTTESEVAREAELVPDLVIPPFTELSTSSQNANSGV